MNVKVKEKVEEGAPSVGIAIRANRMERGWSQVELAARAKLSREFLSMVETRKRTPSLASLERIAACFGKDSGVLLQEAGDAGERLELAIRLRKLALSGNPESFRKLLEFVKTL